MKRDCIAFSASNSQQKLNGKGKLFLTNKRLVFLRDGEPATHRGFTSVEFPLHLSSGGSRAEPPEFKQPVFGEEFYCMVCFSLSLPLFVSLYSGFITLLNVSARFCFSSVCAAIFFFFIRCKLFRGSGRTCKLLLSPFYKYAPSFCLKRRCGRQIVFVVRMNKQRLHSAARLNGL